MTVLERLQAFVLGLEPARRVRLGAAVALAVIAAVALAVWSNQTSWAPVVSGRGYEAALAGAGAVEAADIPYRIAAPDTLEVPAGQLGAAKAAIASSDALPGLGDVSALQLGLTPQAQSWAFLRAAEGDLARMINGMDGILGSQVHLVPGGEALFVGEEREASASVFLKVAPGRSLDQGRVRAIVNLVASAVADLSPDRVSVADDRGNLLAAGVGAGVEDPGSDQLRSLASYQASLEERYVAAVDQALLPVLGYDGGFSVSVKVDLDLTERQTTTRQLETERQAVVSEVTEESSDARGAPQGSPGVDANLPENGPPATTTGDASTRAATTTNYDYPTVDEVSRRPAGGVTRVSVAVQVDAARLAALAEASGGKVEAAELTRQLEAAVRAAVGYDAARKDVVNLAVLPFAAPAWTVGTEPEAPAPTAVVTSALPYLVSLAGIFLLFWFVVRPVVAAVLRPIEPEPAALVLEPSATPLVGGPVEPGTVHDPDADLAQRLRQLVDNLQSVSHSDLNRLVDRETELAADVIRRWARAR